MAKNTNIENDVVEQEENTATENTEETKTTEKTETTAVKSRDEDEMEEIILPYIKDNPVMTVALNGVVTRIKRGERVRVKKGIAEIIRNSQRQDAKTAAMVDELSKNI